MELRRRGKGSAAGRRGLGCLRCSQEHPLCAVCRSGAPRFGSEREASSGDGIPVGNSPHPETHKGLRPQGPLCPEVPETLTATLATAVWAVMRLGFPLVDARVSRPGLWAWPLFLEGDDLAGAVGDSPNCTCLQPSAWAEAALVLPKTWPGLRPDIWGQEGEGVRQGLGPGTALVCPRNRHPSSWPAPEGPRAT